MQTGELVSGEMEMDLCHMTHGPAPVVGVVILFLFMILVSALLGWIRQTRAATLRSVATGVLAVVILFSMLAGWKTYQWGMVWDTDCSRLVGPVSEKTLLLGLVLLVIAVPFLMGRWRRSIMSSH